MKIAEVEWGSPWYAATIDLRYRLLRAPLGLWFSPEELRQESRERHFAVWIGRSLVGCVVATPGLDRLAKVRQMVVEEGFQGRGVGKRLLAFAEDCLRASGTTTVVLHARETAVGFYERQGYRVDGDTFVEVTLPHRRMVKSLTRP